jgi:type IV secretion system protein VirB6
MRSCAAVTDMGLVRDVLTAVDCNTSHFARLGYESLTAAGSPFQTALTLFLTIYVAVIGYRLLFATGGARLSQSPGIALKIGAVLALVTSWSLFQTLVFDMAQRAPVEIAGVISAPLRSTDSFAASPVAGLQSAYDQLTEAAAFFASPPKNIAPEQQTNYAGAAQALSFAAKALFVASAGLIAVITIAIGLLTATGPLFITLFLFFETRGFFAGWVRALAAAAFGLLSTWTLTVLMLHAVRPWLEALSPGGIPDARTGITTAIIVLIFSASQFGALLAGIAIARGFRVSAHRTAAPATAADIQVSSSPLDLISRPARLAEQLTQPAASVTWMDRAGATAAATQMVRRDAAAGATAASVPLGDLYRRPAVTRGTARHDGR